MRSISYITVTAAFAARAFAASTTQIQLFNPGDSQVALTAVAGSVVDVKGDTTTLAVNCVDNPSDECYYDGAITFTIGPSTYSLEATVTTDIGGADGKAIVTADCDITSSTVRAVCTAYVGITASVSDITTSTETSDVSTYSSYEMVYDALTITAGVEKLGSSGSSASETATSASGSTSSHSSHASATGSSGSATSSATSESSSSSASTEAAATASSTAGAMPQQTGLVSAAVVAVAAAVIGAL